jgi:ubiquinone/menaquinone biosynthesis C-methylase UbiE
MNYRCGMRLAIKMTVRHSPNRLGAGDPVLPIAPLQDQHAVTRYFDREASFWQAAYGEATLQGRIYRERQGVALSWIDQLALGHTARILEIGCGAGLLSVALARKGYCVDASDCAPAMLAMARKNATGHQVADRIALFLADVQQLPIPDASYDLVLALGVIPWVKAPQAALREMARVLRPGGYLLVTADNSWRLNYLLDPKLSPILAFPRRLSGAALRRLGLRSEKSSLPPGECHQFHSPRQMRRALHVIGLNLGIDETVGFGPFSFWGRELFSDSFGIKLYRCLQGLCDRRMPILRFSGAQYLALARK